MDKTISRIKTINNDMKALAGIFFNKAASDIDFKAAVKAYNDLDEELQDIMNENDISLKKAL